MSGQNARMVRSRAGDTHFCVDEVAKHCPIIDSISGAEDVSNARIGSFRIFAVRPKLSKSRGPQSVKS